MACATPSYCGLGGDLSQVSEDGTLYECVDAPTWTFNNNLYPEVSMSGDRAARLTSAAATKYAAWLSEGYALSNSYRFIYRANANEIGHEDKSSFITFCM